MRHAEPAQQRRRGRGLTLGVERHEPRVEIAQHLALGIEHVGRLHRKHLALGRRVTAQVVDRAVGRPALQAHGLRVDLRVNLHVAPLGVELAQAVEHERRQLKADQQHHRTAQQRPAQRAGGHQRGRRQQDEHVALVAHHQVDAQRNREHSTGEIEPDDTQAQGPQPLRTIGHQRQRLAAVRQSQQREPEDECVSLEREPRLQEPVLHQLGRAGQAALLLEVARPVERGQGEDERVVADRRTEERDVAQVWGAADEQRHGERRHTDLECRGHARGPAPPALQQQQGQDQQRHQHRLRVRPQRQPEHGADAERALPPAPLECGQRGEGQRQPEHGQGVDQRRGRAQVEHRRAHQQQRRQRRCIGPRRVGPARQGGHAGHGTGQAPRCDHARQQRRLAATLQLEAQRQQRHIERRMGPRPVEARGVLVGMQRRIAGQIE